MSRGLAVTVLALLAACVLAGGVRADGDPASDYLLVSQVFFPYDVYHTLPKAKQAELASLVHDTNKSGYTIRVAVIGSPYDLGSVTSLWGKPREYARFLAAEIAFIYKNRLLVVMPGGFGFNRPKHSSTKEYAVLSKIPIAAGEAGLLTAAETAVQKLAAASGVQIARTPVAAVKTNSGFLHSKLFIVLAALAGVAILVVLRLALRRKVA